jgi:hypothetical protein
MLRLLANVFQPLAAKSPVQPPSLSQKAKAIQEMPPLKLTASLDSAVLPQISTLNSQVARLVLVLYRWESSQADQPVQQPLRQTL